MALLTSVLYYNDLNINFIFPIKISNSLRTGASRVQNYIPHSYKAWWVWLFNEWVKEEVHLELNSRISTGIGWAWQVQKMLFGASLLCGRGLMYSIRAMMRKIVRPGLRGVVKRGNRMMKQTAISPILMHPPLHLVETRELMKTFAKSSKHLWSAFSSFTIPITSALISRAWRQHICTKMKEWGLFR